MDYYGGGGGITLLSQNKVVSTYRSFGLSPASCKNIKQKPLPIPKISELIQELEQGVTYATALDLNMGYYAIRLDKEAQNLSAIIFPWGKYRYNRLPMGINCAPDIFQEKMSILMTGLGTYVLRRPSGYYLGIVSRSPTAGTNCTAKNIRSGPSDKCRQVDILCYRNWVSWFLDNSSGCSTNDQ